MRRVAVLLVLLACNGGPSGGEPTEAWPYAVAQADCAPWDGAATSVYLTAEPLNAGQASPLPVLRLSVYRGMSGVQGKRWPLGEPGPDGAVAVYCALDAECAGATSGWIQFDSGPAGQLSGQYSVIFPDGTRRAGQFRAPVQDVAPMCG